MCYIQSCKFSPEAALKIRLISDKNSSHCSTPAYPNLSFAFSMYFFFFTHFPICSLSALVHIGLCTYAYQFQRKKIEMHLTRVWQPRQQLTNTCRSTIVHVMVSTFCFFFCLHQKTRESDIECSLSSFIVDQIEQGLSSFSQMRGNFRNSKLKKMFKSSREIQQLIESIFRKCILNNYKIPLYEYVKK